MVLHTDTPISPEGGVCQWNIPYAKQFLMAQFSILILFNPPNRLFDTS